MNAAFAQVTQALFIAVDILLEVSGLGLDMFVYGYTLSYRPAQTDGFNHFFPFLDFLYCPYFPVWNMMQVAVSYTHLNRLDTYRRMVNKKISAGQMEELLKICLLYTSPEP